MKVRVLWGDSLDLYGFYIASMARGFALEVLDPILTRMACVEAQIVAMRDCADAFV